ncbi:transcriptional regulator domain-containing protein [Rhizobium sp. L1K21]|uniref:transcriptional regulator domain-containing protein n=1 Tax=Rhizobium sp. L1K21 TaxID=2954933 RepID=UPI0035942E0A
MADHSNWRHSKAYDYVEQLDPAQLAWEFLRRNPDYQKDYDKIPEQKRETASDDLSEQWGLRFPGLPEHALDRHGYLLHTAIRSWNAHPDVAIAGPRIP